MASTVRALKNTAKNSPVTYGPADTDEHLGQERSRLNALLDEATGVSGEEGLLTRQRLYGQLAACFLEQRRRILAIRKAG